MKKPSHILNLSFVVLFSVFLGTFNLACDKVEVRQKTSGSGGGSIEEPQEKTESSNFAFKKDGPGGLFRNLKWYQYDMLTHIIWPFHDVYAFRSPAEVYLLQVQSYYADQAMSPGMFKVAFRVESTGELHSVQVDGRGCGNPYTNPNFEACSKDVEQNLFGVLDFETATAQTMTETAMAADADWDVAFRGTEIRVNAGTVGPGQVRGALAQRFKFYFGADGSPDVSKLRRTDLKSQAIAAFESMPFASGYDYALPDGIDRVFHESYWMAENAEGLRSAVGSYVWIARSADQARLAKLYIPAVEDTKLTDGSYQSAVTLRYQVKDAAAATFAGAFQEFRVELPSTVRLKSMCFRLFTHEVMECKTAGTDWDLKLTAIHRQKDGVFERSWLIFNNNGAIGPLNLKEADTNFP